MMTYVHIGAILFQFVCMVFFAYLQAWPWALWCAVFGGYSMWQLRKGKVGGQ